MFGTDEHSLAMLGQWRKAKVLRDPEQVKQMAESKGLEFFAAMTLDAPMFHVRANEKGLFYGSFEDAAQFVSDYNVLQQPHPAFAEPPLGKR
jgi:hypothetical protein